MIKIDTRDALKTLDHLTKSLTKNEVAKASSMAMNEAVRSGRKEIKDEIRKIYNLKTERIYDTRKERGISMSFATVSNPIAKINAGHMPVNLSNFNPRSSKMESGREITFYSDLRTRKLKMFKGPKMYKANGISVEVRKGQRKNIPVAFQPVAGKAIFARGIHGKPGFVFGKKRLPIGALSSVSIATAALEGNVAPKYQAKIEERYATRIEHQLKRMIDKVESK